jgi:hypothetical protein
MKTMLLAAIVALLGAGSVLAQEAGPYQLERTEDGYVRMDTRTGRMWLCRETSGSLTCDPATETGAAVAPPSDLEARVAALEAQIAGEPQAAGQLPSDEEFERSLSMMERFMRRFMGIARDLERSEDDPTRL